MQALQVPAKHGFAWIVDGYRLFARRPLVIILLVLAYLFLVVISAGLHFLGNCVMAILLPSFSVGMLGAFRRVDAEQPVTMLHLFAGFRSNFPVLLRLGFSYLGILLVGLSLSAMADGGLYLKYLVLDELPPQTAAAQVGLAQMIFLLVLIPGAVALWFAPMLAAWHRLPALQSLFFGLVACVRNYRAFMVYVAALLGICFAAASVVALIAENTGSAKDQVAEMLLMPVVVVLLATVTAGNFLSYRDIFREEAPDPAAAP